MSKFVFFIYIFCFSCSFGTFSNDAKQIVVGGENFTAYLDLIKDRKVGIVANQTSQIDGRHTVDTLLSLGVEIKRIFSPEHGFRGSADAGELIENEIDPLTGIEVISLYGNNKKPTSEQLKNLDVVLFDLQDVGVRYYTYLSTLHYMLESCAENNIEIIILDRPNPNGFYIDGPVLEKGHSSFVGIYPIPVVHGMTLGELALMAVGEQWACTNKKPELKVIKCLNYTHDSIYVLPIKPSPNLPNMRSVYLYPSLCLFEGTVINEGRGTDVPFQVFGHPDLKKYDTIYTPRSIPDASKYPKLEGKKCFGTSLRKIPLRKIYGLNIEYLIETYRQFDDKPGFFTNYFTLLAGSVQLQKDIQNGLNEKEIKDKWKNDLEKFMTERKKYLLYPDFNQQP